MDSSGQLWKDYQHKAFYSYFIVEETEAQRDTATCPKPHSKLTAGMEIETLFFPMPQAAYKKVEHHMGLGPEPRRQELQKQKPEPLP